MASDKGCEHEANIDDLEISISPDDNLIWIDGICKRCGAKITSQNYADELFWEDAPEDNPIVED